MTTLERAARALYALTPKTIDVFTRDCANPLSGVVKDSRPIEWNDLGSDDRGLFVKAARAVLTAIRDIELETEDDVEINMLAEGAATLPEHDEPLQADALACWQAMIDAALAEGG